MRAGSQATVTAARERWEPLLREAGERARTYGEQLFAVRDLLQSSGALRGALSAPSRGAQEKAALAERVLGGRFDPVVVDLLAGLARGRWSHDADLTEAVRLLAVESVLAGAQNAGRLERVQEELFELERTIVAERDLRLALTRPDVAPQARVRLVDELLGSKMAPETLLLVREAVSGPSFRSLRATLHSLVQVAAARRDRLVANVVAAVPLSDAQIGRLERMLERTYARAVHVNVGVDPAVLGGLRIEVGDEVVDATVLTRLEDVRQRLAG